MLLILVEQKSYEVRNLKENKKKEKKEKKKGIFLRVVFGVCLQLAPF